MQLFRRGILTQICGNDFLVLKVAPPFTVGARGGRIRGRDYRDGRDDASFGDVLDRGARPGAARGGNLTMTRFSLISIPLTMALAIPALLASPAIDPVVDRGYRQMYDLNFEQAHTTFAQWELDHPADPLGPASNAAAYLYAEFDRLKILQSELFVDDGVFRKRPKPASDPAVRRAFDGELFKAEQLADDILSRSSEQADALFAKVLVMGLRSDYIALIEKHDLDALKIIKSSRAIAEKLLAVDPSYYDAYLSIGVENYLLSLKAAPVRWLLQMGGAQTDRQRGLESLRLTAEKGTYFKPYARLLLAVAALRNKDREQAREILDELVHEFPHNRLYAEELARLRQTTASSGSVPRS